MGKKKEDIDKILNEFEEHYEEARRDGYYQGLRDGMKSVIDYVTRVISAIDAAEYNIEHEESSVKWGDSGLKELVDNILEQRRKERGL